MLVDQSHCLSVTTIEDSSLSTELYHKIRLLCNKESLLIRKTTIENMIRNHEYEHSLFAQNSSSILGHFTEHFLPDDLHTPGLLRLQITPDELHQTGDNRRVSRSLYS